MRILVIVYSNSSNNKVQSRYNDAPYSTRIQTVLSTWAKHINEPHRFVISGDVGLYNKYPDNKVWITASSTSDTYKRLPFKTLSTLRIALTHKDWDFLIKVDDDTYFRIDVLEKFLKDKDPKADFYGGLYPDTLTERCCGGGCTKCIPFAGGGPGYILSRSALLKCWNILEDIVTSNKHKAEDRALGLAMYQSNITLTHLPTLFTQYNRHRDCKEDVIADTLHGTIGTHPVEPIIMKQIYTLLALQK